MKNSVDTMLDTVLGPLAGTMDAADHALLLRWAADEWTFIPVGDNGKHCVTKILSRGIAEGFISQATNHVLESFRSQKHEIQEHYAARDAKREAEQAAWNEQVRLHQERKEREEAERREREDAARHIRSVRRDALVDAISRRAGYTDSEELRQHDERIHAAVVTAVESYKWGAKGDLLVDHDGVDVYVASGAIYTKVLLPQGILRKTSGVTAGTVGSADGTDGCSGDRISTSAADGISFTSAGEGPDRQRPSAPAPAESRRAQFCENASPGTAPRPTQEEITDRALALLKSDQERSLTYNQIAQSLNLTYKDAYKDVSRAAQALAGASRKTGVIAYKVKDKKNDKVKLFKFAPWRARIDRDPSQTDRIVSQSLIGLIGAEPALSWAALRERMRAAYGHLDNTIIDRCRKTLLDTGEVVCVRGPRGAQMHYIADGRNRIFAGGDSGLSGAVEGNEAACDGVCAY
ncbi:MAG: hypothetical protein H8F28_10440 [Fibrella sp.]|nr:hypothetical protein [Armatimonadota bacterium]